MSVTLAQFIPRLRQRINDRTRRIWSTDDELENAVIDAIPQSWPYIFVDTKDTTSFTGSNALAANTLSIAVPTAFLPSGSRGSGAIWAIRFRMWDGTSATPVPVPWGWMKRGVYPDSLENFTSPNALIRFVQPFSRQCEIELWGGVPLTPPTRYDFTAVASTDIITATTTDTFTNGQTVSLSAPDGGSLPAGLSANTKYYVVSTTGTTFKVSLTNGGSAVDITADGSGSFVVTSTALPGTDIPNFTEWLYVKTAKIARATRSTSNAEDRQGQNTLALLADQEADKLLKQCRMKREHETSWSRF